jgi:signal transduction histidine kinase
MDVRRALRLERDPDRLAVRRSALRIGVQVAIVSAALVVVIIGLVIGYVLYQSSPGEQLEKHGPWQTRIYVDRHDMLVALAIIGGFAVICAGFATWIVARRAVRPIGEALRIQRTFVADASHELRTPLTVLDMRVQQLRRRIATEDPNSPVIDALRDDAHALIDIVNDLLDAASVQNGREGIGTSELRTELDHAVDDIQVLAEAKHVRIDHAPAQATIGMPAVALRRCLVALLDNAVAHSPDGSSVEVAVVPAGRHIRVLVRDHGSGIQGIAPGRVFERFAHGSVPAAAPTTHRTGFGIGLSLVQDIATRYRGAVSVTATDSGGTTFALDLPTR